MIFADGRAALGDFGASRFAAPVTRAYTEAGTFGYIAPEQAYGRARFSSDVFSLGLIAYEVLTGFLPTWPFEWPPERYRTFTAKVPEPARPVLRKAAQFDPSRRYSDGQQFSDALEHAFAEVEAHAQTAPRRRRKPRLPELSPLAVQAEAFRRGHGRSLELLYRCHRCDGPIAEPMKHCPWCGSAGNSFAHLTSAAIARRACARSGRRARGAMRGASRATAGGRRATRKRCACAARAAAGGSCARSCTTARCASAR